MSTQKTNLGGNVPQPPTEDQEDLGLSENQLPVAEDPSGFVANAPVQELSGRAVRPLSNDDLTRAHKMQAGDVPMFGNPSVGQQGRELPPVNSQQRAPAANPQAQQKAEELLPDYLRNAPTQQAQPSPQSPPAHYAQRAEKSYEVRSHQFDEVGRALEHLLTEEETAKTEGDYLGAHQARRMIEGLVDDYQFEKIQRKRSEHPGMAKLKANLGLSQIKPTSIEWAGSIWMFAATNARLDRWVSDNTREDAFNIAPLLICGSLVGLDNIPMFEFLGLPLEEDYVLIDRDENNIVIEERKVTVKKYWKHCNCGAKIDVRAESCSNCGALHSKFEMPTDLRLDCADAFFNFLEEQFGPYEELALLLKLKNDVMKDRRFDKEDLFPLAMPSPEQKTTPTSQSGDES